MSIMNLQKICAGRTYFGSYMHLKIAYNTDLYYDLKIMFNVDNWFKKIIILYYMYYNITFSVLYYVYLNLRNKSTKIEVCILVFM